MMPTRIRFLGGSAAAAGASVGAGSPAIVKAAPATAVRSKNVRRLTSDGTMGFSLWLKVMRQKAAKPQAALSVLVVVFVRGLETNGPFWVGGLAAANASPKNSIEHVFRRAVELAKIDLG